MFEIFEILLVVLASVYFVALGVLAIYGVNFLYLTGKALRHNHKVAPPVLAASDYPSVTVQLPIFNERYVAERLIDAAAKLDYPPALLEIQVLDDSTDETVALAGQRVAFWQAQGVNIRHIRRPHRTGYKAGALAYGMTQTGNEFFAIFDADFLPPPDYLRRIMPHIAGAQSSAPALTVAPVAFAQARWGHLNRAGSLLTRLQALGIDGHLPLSNAPVAKPGTSSTLTARLVSGDAPLSKRRVAGPPTP